MALLAHPLTEISSLPVSPLAAAGMAAAVAVGLALYWPKRSEPAAPGTRTLFESWEGALRPSQVVGRAVAVALLLVAVVAGRVGDPRELDNLAAPLVIGLAWPSVVLLAATLGPVWRWLDPWDGATRLLERPQGPGPGQEPVHAAIVPGLLFVWFLGVYPTPLDPRAAGLVLGAYTVGTVGGCLALGRREWLSRAEVFGLFFAWLSRLPRGALSVWQPPAGSSLLLGVLAGGLLFGAIRRTDLWGGLNALPAATAWATVGLVGTCGAFAGALWGLERGSSRRRSPEDPLERGSVVRVTVPMVASVALAVSMARGRLFTSIALLPRLASDPLGLGWDLFGWADRPVPPPLTEPQLAAVQLAVLLGGVIAGSFVLARVAPRARLRGTLALALLVLGGTIAVMLTPGVAPR